VVHPVIDAVILERKTDGIMGRLVGKPQVTNIVGRLVRVAPNNAVITDLSPRAESLREGPSVAFRRKHARPIDEEQSRVVDRGGRLLWLGMLMHDQRARPVMAN
jgi:hypothetical protein